MSTESMFVSADLITFVIDVFCSVVIIMNISEYTMFYAGV